MSRSLVMLVMLALFGQTSLFAEDMNKGSTSQQSKTAALRALPLEKLNKNSRAKIAAVVKNPSIYRRLPVSTIECDPDLFVYLVRYPEIVVNIWQIMGATRMQATRTAPYVLKTDDGGGTTGKVDLVYGSGKQHVYYCEGQYDGPLLLRPVKARCVILLQTEFFSGRDGRPRAQNRLDIFLKIDNMAANAVAKTVHPLVGSTADHNFIESLKFIENLHHTTVENGPGVQRLGARLNQVGADVRQKFQQIAGLVYVRANQPSVNRGNQNSSNPMVGQTQPSISSPQQTDRVAHRVQSSPGKSGVRHTLSSGPTTKSPSPNSNPPQQQSVLVRPKR